MKATEMLEIVNSCVPVENGFLNPDTGEIFTEEQLLDIVGDLNEAIDRIGMSVLECVQRKNAKKELAKHYTEQAKIEENREERLKYYLGYLTQGKKGKYQHVSISFLGKQERLGWLDKKNLPDVWKKDSVSRIPDEAKIREALSVCENAKEGEEISNNYLDALKYAYIDRRKKATVK